MGERLTSLQEQVPDLPKRVPHSLRTLGAPALKVLGNGTVVAAAPHCPVRDALGRAGPHAPVVPLTAETSRKNWRESPRPATDTTGALAASAPATRWGYFILR